MLQYKKASLLPEIGWNFNNKSSTNLLNHHNHNNQNLHNNSQDDRSSQKSSISESFFLSKSSAATGSNLSTKLKSDTKIVPLLLCHLFKYSQTSLSENRQHQTSNDDLNDPCIITIFSPDLKRSLILRCQDEMTAYTWACAISTEIHETTLNALAEANMNLSPVLNSTIKYMGWLSEKVSF